MPRGLIRELRGRIVASEGLCVGPCDNHAPVRPRPVAVPSSVETRAFLCLCVGACGIACAPILVRLSETGPVASAFWRAAVAAPVLCLWARRAAPRPVSASLRPAVAAGLFFAADLAVWHWSITYTSVANATLLANLAPIFVTLASWFFLRKRVTRPFLVGMVTAIAGMFVLVGPNFAAGGTRLAGDALGALTAVFYAGYMLAIKTARDAGISTLRLMAWSTSMTAVALLPAALFSPQPLLPQSPAGWAILAALALVSQVLGQGLIAFGFAHLSASLSSVSLLLQPVLATLFAWALFSETIGPSQLIGGGVVLGGIWLARRGS